MDEPKVGDIRTVLRKKGSWLVDREQIYSQGKWIDFYFTESEINKVMGEIKDKT